MDLPWHFWSCTVHAPLTLEVACKFQHTHTRTHFQFIGTLIRRIMSTPRDIKEIYYEAISCVLPVLGMRMNLTTLCIQTHTLTATSIPNLYSHYNHNQQQDGVRLVHSDRLKRCGFTEGSALYLLVIKTEARSNSKAAAASEERVLDTGEEHECVVMWMVYGALCSRLVTPDSWL